MTGISVQPLQAPLLKEASNEEGFRLHRAALEWDIQEQIVIENPEDVKSKADWHNTLDPFHHQVQNLMTFCRRLPVTLLADDVGLGKTISAGLILSELMSRNRVSKALVICPKILMPQWKEELKSKFGIPSTCGSGIQEIRRAVESLKDADEGIFITTYASARSHLDLLEKSGFQMLILDEAHKLRNLYGTENAPQVALRLKKALSERAFKYVLMLTATPIHNRLWDLYSLIDLMTVAKGHQNPFGTEDHFARRYIADDNRQARKLVPERKEEFRGIVYGYMSRVRRADAKLVFPERRVKLRRVQPSASELALIRVVSLVIEGLNRLTQISLLKALVSSPQALVSETGHMAEKGTMKAESASRVADAAKRIGTTSKLLNLEALTDELRKERPQDWRMVVFTQFLETQKAIAEHMEAKGIPFGIISGESSRRNQESIRRFSATPPEVNVIISTEAGAEGVNMQAANVLVNYDLPWNPMIVEQRIGRIQRLGSKHANVTIFNAILQGTFEDYIVGRLMEKLQMATSAIGDIDSLLEEAGLDGDEGETSFEEMIRKLVVDSLAGKNVEEDARLKTESISRAKKEIEREEAEINNMLGGMGDPLRSGPRAPRMSPPNRSMSVKEFVLTTLKGMGQTYREDENDVFICDGTMERITFEAGIAADESTIAPTYYAPGRPAFDRLLAKHLSNNESVVVGLDVKPRQDLESIGKIWVSSFGGEPVSISNHGLVRQFDGKAFLRARVSMAHDSFEKLVDVGCVSKNPMAETSGVKPGMVDPGKLGLDNSALVQALLEDPDIKEFSRFYLERRDYEMQAAGDDVRKRRKLEDEFTPRMEPSLVGLNGKVSSSMETKVSYRMDGEGNYTSLIQVDVESGAVTSEPLYETCAVTSRRVPVDCLGRCQVSGTKALKHRLIKSEISDQSALPSHTVVCCVSGKRVVSTETALSSVTGKPVIRALLKTSVISGKLAEPEFVGKCEFSGSDVLTVELMTSQVSGKRYRMDQELSSSVTGKKGHQSEFIACPITRKPLLSSEAEKCDVTGKLVSPGILATCEISGKKVIPSELGVCGVSGKRVLLNLLEKSSISKETVLRDLGIRSTKGKYCLPSESVSCVWDGKVHHPEDISWCSLTGVAVCHENLVGSPAVLKQLVEILNRPINGTNAPADQSPLLKAVGDVVGKGHYRVLVEESSPNGYAKAVTVEASAWLGLKKRVLGLVFLPGDGKIAGKVAKGRLESGKWRQEIS